MTGMVRVAGIDLALASTGIAVITRRTDGTCTACATTITSRGKRDDGLPQRASRITTLAADIDRAAGDAVLAVVEAPVYNARGGSPVDRHHLWWLVVAALLRRSVPVVAIAPAKLKQALTGAGNADKAAVSGAVARLWPDLELRNADEADALGLAQLGAVHLGWPVPTLARHREHLASVDWPPKLAEAIR